MEMDEKAIEPACHSLDQWHIWCTLTQGVESTAATMRAPGIILVIVAQINSK